MAERTLHSVDVSVDSSEAFGVNSLVSQIAQYTRSDDDAWTVYSVFVGPLQRALRAQHIEQRALRDELADTAQRVRAAEQALAAALDNAQRLRAENEALSSNASSSSRRGGNAAAAAAAAASGAAGAAVPSSSSSSSVAGGAPSSSSESPRYKQRNSSTPPALEPGANNHAATVSFAQMRQHTRKQTPPSPTQQTTPAAATQGAQRQVSTPPSSVAAAGGSTPPPPSAPSGSSAGLGVPRSSTPSGSAAPTQPRLYRGLSEDSLPVTAASPLVGGSESRRRATTVSLMADPGLSFIGRVVDSPLPLGAVNPAIVSALEARIETTSRTAAFAIRGAEKRAQQRVTLLERRLETALARLAETSQALGETTQERDELRDQLKHTETLLDRSLAQSEHLRSSLDQAMSKWREEQERVAELEMVGMMSELLVEGDGGDGAEHPDGSRSPVGDDDDDDDNADGNRAAASREARQQSLLLATRSSQQLLLPTGGGAPANDTTPSAMRGRASASPVPPPASVTPTPPTSAAGMVRIAPDRPRSPMMLAGAAPERAGSDAGALRGAGAGAGVGASTRARSPQPPPPARRRTATWAAPSSANATAMADADNSLSGDGGDDVFGIPARGRRNGRRTTSPMALPGMTASPSMPSLNGAAAVSFQPPSRADGSRSTLSPVPLDIRSLRRAEATQVYKRIAAERQFMIALIAELDSCVTDLQERVVVLQRELDARPAADLSHVNAAGASVIELGASTDLTQALSMLATSSSAKVSVPQRSPLLTAVVGTPTLTVPPGRGAMASAGSSSSGGGKLSPSAPAPRQLSPQQQRSMPSTAAQPARQLGSAGLSVSLVAGVSRLANVSAGLAVPVAPQSQPSPAAGGIARPTAVRSGGVSFSGPAFASGPVGHAFTDRRSVRADVAQALTAASREAAALRALVGDMLERHERGW